MARIESYNPKNQFLCFKEEGLELATEKMYELHAAACKGSDPDGLFIVSPSGKYAHLKEISNGYYTCSEFIDQLYVIEKDSVAPTCPENYETVGSHTVKGKTVIDCIGIIDDATIGGTVSGPC